MADVIYLEVDRSNQAILSYVLELPTTPSNKVEYVPATHAELAYLNGLEDAVFAPGTVATLTDLTDHRARVKAAQAASKAKTALPQRPAPKASQKPSTVAGKASSPTTTSQNRVLEQMRRHWATKSK